MLKDRKYSNVSKKLKVKSILNACILNVHCTASILSKIFKLKIKRKFKNSKAQSLQSVASRKLFIFQVC